MGVLYRKTKIRFFIEDIPEGYPGLSGFGLGDGRLWQGMTPEETTELTLAMADSGDTWTYSSVCGHRGGQAFSGGVGDKTSIAVVPMVRACGLPVVEDDRPRAGY